MALIVNLLILALDVYLWIIIATIVASWLVLFGVLNARNTYIRKALALMERVTEPLILQIRKVVPLIGGIDLSPIVIIVGISLLQRFLYGLL